MKPKPEKPLKGLQIAVNVDMYAEETSLVCLFSDIFPFILRPIYIGRKKTFYLLLFIERKPE